MCAGIISMPIAGEELLLDYGQEYWEQAEHMDAVLHEIQIALS
jgi:hypothetical protein